MARISIEIPSVTHCVFLLGDADGMMDKPPHLEGSKLIKLWKSGEFVETEHNTEQDVTGGIELKAERASLISKKVGRYGSSMEIVQKDCPSYLQTALPLVRK